MLANKDGQTPIHDTDGLLVPAATMEELNVYEYKNVLKAITKYELLRLTDENTKFNYEWFMQVHQDMFGDVWEWAGTARLQNVAPLGVEKEKIGQEMHALTHNIRNLWILPEYNVMEAAVRIHHHLTKIHPFKNGNGRHARLVTNIFLKKNDYKSIIWPDHQNDRIRQKYLNALRKADSGDYKDLVSFHLSYYEGA